MWHGYIPSLILILLFFPPHLLSVDYSPKLSDKDPQLLLQQQIPHSFLTLQESIREVVDRYRHEELAPIMDDSQFV